MEQMKHRRCLSVHRPEEEFAPLWGVISPRNLSLEALNSAVSSQGAYYLRKDTQVIGVFKAQSEGDLMNRAGIVDGESTLKERAAFMMDHDSFARVPDTELLWFQDENKTIRKFGSLQNYVNHRGSAEDYSSSLYSVRDVQSIGLLDLRLFNTDRHMGNMIVCDLDQTSTGETIATLPGNEYRLIPIDHGFILPDFRCLSDGWYEWWGWKQANQPFVEACVEYTERIDVQEDCNKLLDLGLRKECVLTYVLCTLCVKHGVCTGMTLKQLADVFQRDIVRFEEPSILERLVNSALEVTISTEELYQLSDLSRNEFVQNFKVIMKSEIGSAAGRF